MSFELDKLFEQALSVLRAEEAGELDLWRKNLTPSGLPSEAVNDKPGELTEEQEAKHSENIGLLIRNMPIPQRIKLAIFGNQTARQILIRDTNRMVALFVLQNARITDAELNDIVKNTNVDEAVLRTVGTNTEWMKGYSMKLGFVSNPKAPGDVALRWIKFLQEKDLRRLSKSKGIPQLISGQCRKLLESRKLPGAGE